MSVPGTSWRRRRTSGRKRRSSAAARRHCPVGQPASFRPPGQSSARPHPTGTALGVNRHQYDALQRLAYEGQFVDAAREYENYYEYDAAGNRTLLRHGETDAEDLTYYEYNAANELLSAHDVDGWTYFAYDANGNTVSEQRPSYTRYYNWDGRDMMVGVRSTEAGWTDNVYRYDGMAAACKHAGVHRPHVL